MRRFTLPTVLLALFAAAGTSATQVGSPQPQFAYAVLPDSFMGAVLVRADQSTGEVRFRVPKSEIEETLRIAKQGKDDSKDPAAKERMERELTDLQAISGKDWLTFKEYHGHLVGHPGYEDLSAVVSKLSDVNTTLGSIHSDVDSIWRKIDR